MFESVLVTGGCGFIGANLCRRLESAAIRVTVLDNMSRASVAGLSGVKHEIIDGRRS